MVALVLAQMLGDLVDALGELRDLHLYVPGVVLVGAELGCELALAFTGQGHGRRRTLADADARASVAAQTAAARSTSSCIAAISASLAVEAPFAAQPLEEAQAQLGPVEVAVEVDQEGLDQLVHGRSEGRPHADTDSRRPSPARHA